MKNVFKSIANYVFSFGMYMFLMSLVFGFLIYTINAVDTARKDRTLRVTEACYSQGMVPVDTDAGLRCADPRSFVKIK